MAKDRSHLTVRNFKRLAKSLSVKRGWPLHKALLLVAKDFDFRDTHDALAWLKSQEGVVGEASGDAKSAVSTLPLGCHQ